MQCPTEAKRSYDRALTDGVERDLVVDRYRRLAKWFSKAQMFKEALELLKSVRHLDEVLIDSDIDHLHKELIRQEDEGRDGSATKAPPPPACAQP